ncbi:MAG: PQQ-binding-like beta-propeller repeat protein, partial [Deltaproteobacteria bacterium]|nr:PQQ-binding-like beta-propeller repeat protein [Deltaproteobacteria bacterium]
MNVASASPWPAFHRDIQGTGLSNIDTSSATGAMKWMFTTGGRIYSTPAIGADGTIYLSSLDDRLYAVNTLGGL